MIKFAAWFVSLVFFAIPFAVAALVYLPFERRILRSLDFASQVSEKDRDFWMGHHRKFADRQGRIGGWLAIAAFVVGWLMVGFVYANWQAVGREIATWRDYYY